MSVADGDVVEVLLVEDNALSYPRGGTLVIPSTYSRIAEELERHRLSQQSCLGDDALDRRSELAQRRFSEMRPGSKPLGKTGQ